MKKSLFLILILLVFDLGFAEQNGNLNSSLYKSVLMTDGSYTILQNMDIKITTQYTSCSMLNKGVQSFPGGQSSSQSSCWVAGHWSNCSTNCGAGVKTRSIDCLDFNGETSTLCRQSLRPEDQTSCSSSLSCEYEWRVSEWEECPSMCGEYETSRTVTCVKDKQYGVEDVFCTGHNKPISTRDCIETPQCEYLWTASEWSSCPTGCGLNFKNRTVRCVDNNNYTVSNSLCGVELKPIEIESCPNYNNCSFNIRASSDDTSTYYVSNKNGDQISVIGSQVAHATKVYSINANPDADGYIWIRVDWRNNGGVGGVYLQNTTTGGCFSEHLTPGKTKLGRAASEWYNGPCWIQASATNTNHTWLYKYKVF